MIKSSIPNEKKIQSDLNKSSVSTNINEPSPDYGSFAKENEMNGKFSFPLIEIETADSFSNPGNGNHPQGSLYDLGTHQPISSNIFDSSTSAIFDESEIDIENASFVSEISSLAFSSNISSLQSPTSIQKVQRKRYRNYDKDSWKHGKRRKKNKNKLFPEEDFQFKSPDHFLDYFQCYEDPSMPVVLSKRWNKKSLELRKKVICAYRAEDARIINTENDKNIQQNLREEEEMRREKIADYDISLISTQNHLPPSDPIYDNQDRELEIDKNQLQLSRSCNLNTDATSNEIGIHNDEEERISESEDELIDDSELMGKNINPILIFSLAIRFLFYVGYILNLC